MSDTIKAINEAFNSTAALEAVGDPQDTRGLAATNAAAEPDDPGAPTFLPEAAVCRRYGVSDTTIIRWDADERLGFPKALLIRGRKYRRLSELLEFEARQARDPQVTKWRPRGCVGGTDEAA